MCGVGLAMVSPVILVLESATIGFGLGLDSVSPKMMLNPTLLKVWS